MASGFALAVSIAHLSAQVTPGRNVNMVSGTEWPGGDPYLNKQNEPNVAVSTRNVLHLLAGANDYRTVDLPGLPEDRPTGDAWLGLFKSVDGGKTWTSTLIPGYPQDSRPVGATSPLKLNNYTAAADPVVRAGSNGLFYYGGIAFQRDAHVTNAALTAAPPAGASAAAPRKRGASDKRAKKNARIKEGKEAGVVNGTGSAVFVSTFLDLNNLEAGDPIRYVRTSLVDSDPGDRFLDKQWTAVDIPRPGAATCHFEFPQDDGSVLTQSFPGGRVYVAYTAFRGAPPSQTATILFSASQDCGETWSSPRDISTVPDPDLNDDGLVDSVDVNLVRASYGRRCGQTGFNPAADVNKDCVINLIDLTFVTRNFGKAYSTERRIPQAAAIAIHPVTGAVYVTWREFRSATLPDAIQFVKSTNFGASFTPPLTISTLHPFDQGTSPTSFRSSTFPTIAAGTDRIYVAWSARGYGAARPDPATGDARIVMSTSSDGAAWTAPFSVDEGNLPGHQIMPALAFGRGRLSLVYYDLREDVSNLFQRFVDEFAIVNDPASNPLRHTIDVRLAQATAAPIPVFQSIRLSEYAQGVLEGTAQVQQLQFNPPNLPLFRRGEVPFLGDYIGIDMAPSMIATPDGQWTFDTAPSAEASGYAVWTDNRNVRAGPAGSFVGFTPPNSPARQETSRYDPSQVLPQCEPLLTGTRNQDVFSARFDRGLFAAVLGNAKPLGQLQRAFALFVENGTDVPRSYRLTITPPPTGVASFLQFGAPLTVLDVSIPRYSTVARTVFITSGAANTRVIVNVAEIDGPGAADVITGGRATTVVINADPSNPAIENPAIENPAIENLNIAAVEVFNPIMSPAIENPAIENPAIENPAIENPAIENVTVENRNVINPAIENPAIENPAIENPAIENPAIENATLADGSIADTTWELTNNGNTAAVYTVRLLLTQEIPAGIQTQLIIHKTYTTPAAAGCELRVQEHNVVLLNVTNPAFVEPGGNPAIENPAIENPAIENATVAVAPGDTVHVTLRVFDPDANDAVTFRPAAAVTPAAIAQAVNSDEAQAGITVPSSSIPLAITTPGLPDVLIGSGPYAAVLTANSVGTWAVTAGTLPPGLVLEVNTGAISGTPNTPGTFAFTVEFTDTATGDVVSRQFVIRIGEVLAFATTALNDAIEGRAYEAAITAQGGIGTVVYSVDPPGELPAGLDLSPTGLLSGIPDTTGTFNFTVRATDSAVPPNSVTQSFSLHMASGGVTDLSVALLPLPSPVTFEETLTYTLQVSNTGLNGAADIVVTQTLPASVTFLSADPQCTRSGSLVTCELGNLANFGSQTKTVEIRVVPEVGGVTLISTAEVTSALGDSNPANDFGSASTAVTGPGQSQFWVTEYDEPRILRYAAPTNGALTSVVLGNRINDVVFRPDGAVAYVTVPNSNVIALIHTASALALASIPVTAPENIAISPDGDRLYVTKDDNTVQVFDTASNLPVTTVAVGESPFGIAVTPDGGKVFVANRLSDSVSVIDTSNNSVIATVPLSPGDLPVEVAIAPNGKRAYVTTYFGHGVVVIDTTTHAIVTTIPVGTGPQGIAIAPDGRRAYVASFDAELVNVIDLVTNTVTATTLALGNPNGVVVSPDGDQVYVTLFNGDAIAVISTLSNEITTTITGAEAPFVVKYVRRKADF